ncbi:MAG: hypothetical protein ACLFM7_12735 [Bacteroidales bacterium]
MGKAKKMIDELIEKKAQGNSFQVNNIKMKLMFKGIIPDEITEDTPDTEELISKIEGVAEQFEVSLTTNK